MLTKPTFTTFALLVVLSLGHAHAQSNGSLWNANSKTLINPLYGDPLASNVGDLVTIVVNLSSVASQDKSTQTDKSSEVNDTITSLVYPQSDGDWDWYRYRDLAPEMAWSANRSFQGGGEISNSETFVTTIQARVIDVLPNGNLQVEARRSYKAGNETTSLVLTGVVRREDLDRENSVSSSLVADLNIEQEGVGDLSRSQKKGWLIWLYETISPF